MAYTRYIGDVHGYKNELESLLKNLPEDVTAVTQVGDMGVGFGQGEYWHYSLDNTLIQHNARFIRGNHDSPEICKSMRSWIPDGAIEDDIMYIGGAWSIDQAYRTRGYDWWEDEELSYEQLNLQINVYDMLRPIVMVTHDCPTIAATEMFINTNKALYKGIQYKTRTASAFQTMFEIHQPQLWIFGHWHHTKEAVINGTRFVCINELDYIDVNTKTLEIVRAN